MSAGKRTSTADPLTEHDVADRIDKAGLRLLRILIEIREMEMVEEVKTSRYFTNALPALAAEMQTWGIEPHPLRPSAEPT